MSVVSPSSMSADSPFGEGASISLQRADGHGPLQFVIEKSLEPFTKSVVLVAHCSESPSQSIALKIFDPRYFDERGLNPGEYGPGLVWSPETEGAAVASLEPLRWGASHFILEELDELDELEENLEGSGEDTHVVSSRRAERWELFFQTTMQRLYATELEAYTRLHSLQGSFIPRLLYHGHHVPQDARAYKPPMLVLEHIDGITVRAAPTAAFTTPIINQLYRDLSRFSQYGVLHNDLNWGNFILSPAQSPHRAVVIDFANAVLRREESDEEWEDATITECEPMAVIAILKFRRIPWHPALEMEEYKLNPLREQPS